MFIRGIWLIILMCTLASCSARKLTGSSRVVMTAPRKMTMSLPSGRQACYGVSVRGPGIVARSANSCSPPTGVVTGFVKSGEQLELDIPKGEGRIFDILLFLMPYGDTGPCPTFNGALANSQLSATYLVGTTSVDLVQDSTDVVIQTAFPGLARNIAYQTDMSATCKAYARPDMPPTPYAISAGGTQRLTGTGYTVQGQVGLPHQRPVLSGAGYKVIVR